MQVSKTIGRVIWRRTLDNRSFEECDVTATPDGFAIAGHVIAAQDGAPLVVHYDIDCGENWSARSVAIDQSFGNVRRRLRLDRAGDGWLVDGVHDARLDGCALDQHVAEPSQALSARFVNLGIARFDVGEPRLQSVA